MTILKRKKRQIDDKEIYLATNLSTDSETIGDLEYEIEEDKFIGRGNLGIPNMIKNSIPLSRKIGLVTEPIVALKRTIKIKPKEKTVVDLIISVGREEEKTKENIKNNIDLQLSGHTHNGQMFSLSYSYNLQSDFAGNYGKETFKHHTKIISSGLVGWGFPIRTEGICEYVVVNITQDK